MDHPPGGQPVPGRRLGVARVAPTEAAALLEQRRTRGPVDGAVDAAAAQQGGVGGIDDGVDLERRDVRTNDPELHRTILPLARSGRSQARSHRCNYTDGIAERSRAKSRARNDGGVRPGLPLRKRRGGMSGARSSMRVVEVHMRITIPSETDNEAKGWQDFANCLGVDPDLFFPERGASTREAKEVCRGCVVRGGVPRVRARQRREVRHLGRHERARAPSHPPPARPGTTGGGRLRLTGYARSERVTRVEAGLDRALLIEVELRPPVLRAWPRARLSGTSRRVPPGRSAAPCRC